ncbi:hypothetical protein AK812_SmicGene2398 [Symbiodinium microadriaticum]|uniref:Uncharacterized protein n=1 Tax=Symbiodinium microadriaticum TaxID=2951 RepID=A0A1Q9F1P6_SYMMI|nr:hypothetical protein AK812_SmicGene2398 [Symbiodinium microadriaticum]
MSAQLYNGDSAAVPKPGPPQGDGTMMVNGTAAEGQGADTSGVGGSGSLGNPNLLDTMQLGDRPGPLPANGPITTPPPQVDPPYGNPDMGANVVTATVTRAEQTRDRPAPSTPSSSTFRVQEFFTSQSSPGNESQGIRWMTRFSEFLRTTATRGVHWMDGLGMQAVPGQSGNVGQATATGTYQMNISPPEEMPPRPRYLDLHRLREERDTERVLYRGHMVYLRVRTYQKGITVLYLYKPHYMEASVYPRVKTYQKGITALYLYKLRYLESFVPLRVMMYQEGITVLYLPRLCRQGAMLDRVRMGWSKAIDRWQVDVVFREPCQNKEMPIDNLEFWVVFMVRCHLYPRVRTYQEGIMVLYPRVRTYQEGIMVLYPRVRTYQEGIMVLYPRVRTYQEGDPQDKMALLADGITQLQAAMLKQYDKTKEGDRSPSENIKPGTSVLPLLKDVAADTACVDIMDWMELIDAPMSDLSDGSASWWRRVVTEAYRTYGLWTLASPVERLTIAPEVGDLETGQWSRVNSRAASMIVMALPDGVKSEVVARRQATSTTKLLYRLLQLYQPGGEDEKVKILGHLQAPPPEQSKG